MGHILCISRASLVMFIYGADAEETDKVKGLKETMLSFCSIQRDMELIEAAAKHVMTQVQCTRYLRDW